MKLSRFEEIQGELQKNPYHNNNNHIITNNNNNNNNLKQLFIIWIPLRYCNKKVCSNKYLQVLHVKSLLLDVST